jgi:hypothetical protein
MCSLAKVEPGWMRYIHAVFGVARYFAILSTRRATSKPNSARPANFPRQLIPEIEHRVFDSKFSGANR